MSIRPDYYTQNGLEAFDVIKAFFMDKAFLSHAFKYMARAGRKGDEREDIRKAITYLEAHLETLGPGAVTVRRKFRRLDDENAYEEEVTYVTGGK